MPNSLTRHVGLNAGPWLLETLVKHYFDQFFAETKSKAKKSELLPGAGGNANIRREELLYDEAFHIVKAFLEVASRHTVEELQSFSNARTPSSPFTHVVRLRVPMSCCDQAAKHLIVALGGEEVANRIVGGTKWWQVRGIRGVDAQWIVAKKDYQQAKKQQKTNEKYSAEINEKNRTDDTQDAEPIYSPEMDEMRCILYFHGGGYYFGSVDQERYFLQRYARKFGGRILAINYRLSPQYPFPCAIQDALAAYLFLIRPPAGSLHKPINPSHIVLSGNSAGGGLTLAVLQVIRDSGLPKPGGGILISPWCDLTHSFPSIHLNTETDVNPKYGLCLHKPSPLWPPPSEQMTTAVQSRLRSRIKEWAKLYRQGASASEKRPARSHRKSECDCFFGCTFCGLRPTHRLTSPSEPSLTLAESAETGDVRASAVFESERRGGRGSVDVGAMNELPSPTQTSEQTISLVTEDGEELMITDQVQLYAPNNLLGHPLVSPVVSYLGGLPPLFIVASDAEVLRDEILHTAHKAGHPERYPIKESTKDLYPALRGMEERHGPTQVHLQVYDETAHVLPVLFPFTRPAKYCFRAIAIFAKFITGIPLPIRAKDASIDSDPHPPMAIRTFLRRATSLMASQRTPTNKSRRGTSMILHDRPSYAVEEPREIGAGDDTAEILHGSRPPSSDSERTEEVVASPTATTFPDRENARYAGDPIVYKSAAVHSSKLFPPDNMIRERVSIHGEIRAMEPEDDIEACKVDPQHVGVVAELVIRRYIEGRKRWDTMFAHTVRSIEKKRRKNLESSVQEARVRNFQQLQAYLFQDADEEERQHLAQEAERNGQTSGMTEEPANGKAIDRDKIMKEGFNKSAASWAWAWAIDGVERPPSSSIVSRRDTKEARRLAIIADQPMKEDDQGFSGNNLWSFLVNVLSADRNNGQKPQNGEVNGEQNGNGNGNGNGDQSSSSGKREGSLRRKFLSLRTPKQKSVSIQMERNATGSSETGHG